MLAMGTSKFLHKLDRCLPCVEQEIDVVLVDVGPHMHLHLDDLSSALFNFCLTKVDEPPSPPNPLEADILRGFQSMRQSVYGSESHPPLISLTDPQQANARNRDCGIWILW